jgi:hypothetical protein
VELTDRRRGNRVGEEPNHTTGETAWSFIYHSTLSGPSYVAWFLQL